VLTAVTKPVILLIGGATGTGKSTVATEVAYRLGINRVTSTDIVRQTLRAFFVPEYMPSIHRSSFDAGTGESLVDGFLDQTTNVLIAVEASIERALQEGWSMVLEGVHLVPGMLSGPRDDATVVQCVLSIEDEAEHATHFWIRDAALQGLRPVQKYLERLDDIRRLQEFIVERARGTGVPVIENTNVDETVRAVIELVLGTAAEPLERV
jgi:2-phosphoglycerate kinase